MANGSNSLLFTMDLDGVAKYAVSCGLARALAENTELELHQTGGLDGVAGFCSWLSGGTAGVSQDWNQIEKDQAKYSASYMKYLLESAAEGPYNLAGVCEKMTNTRNNYYARVQQVFQQAAAKNASSIKRAEWGFEAARAVKIASLGTLALLGAVGGAAGAAGATAFGVTFEGFGFCQGLLTVLGTKAAYSGATSWALETDNIKAIAVKMGETAQQDGGNTLKQTTVERTVSMSFYAKMQSWSESLRMSGQHNDALQKANRRLQTAMNSGNQQAIASAERNVARKTATIAKHSGRVTSARVGATVVQNGLPLLWLALDMKGVWNEANKDAALLK